MRSMFWKLLGSEPSTVVVTEDVMLPALAVSVAVSTVMSAMFALPGLSKVIFQLCEAPVPCVTATETVKVGLHEKMLCLAALMAVLMLLAVVSAFESYVIGPVVRSPIFSLKVP